MKEKLGKKERRALEKATKNGIYLYCITPQDVPKNLGFSGFGDNDVYAITYNNLAAVVSDAPMMEYEPTEENTSTHKDVALKVLKDHSVLPVALGMVFKNRKILLGTMRKVYPLLRKSLLAVDNKVELGVKVILPREGMGIEGLKGEPQGDNLKEIGRDFLTNLEGVAKSSKEGKLFSDRLALNASFLVDKADIEAFSKKLGTLEKKHPQLRVQYSGPWPAYNFVDVKIMSKGRG